MDKISFNSFVSRENYAVIRGEAFTLDIPVKKHISNIITNYAETKRKEAESVQIEITVPAAKGKTKSKPQQN